MLYTVIIPAFNEAACLPATLAQLQQARAALDVAGEIIVVDNNSTDDTAGIARQAGAEVVFEAVNQISRARNAGARRARGRYLIFLDADTLLPAETLKRALDNLRSGECCGGGAEVVFEKPVAAYAHKVLDFWNWYSRKRVIAAGCFVYCLREAFEAVGGFSEGVYASEEIWLSKAVKKWGKKRQMAFTIIPEPKVITSVRKLEWYNTFRVLLFALPILLCPPLLRVQYFCRSWYRRP